MVRDDYNVIPVSLAVLLHGLLFGALVVGFDWTRRDHPPTPLAIKATIVTDSAVTIPPPVERIPDPVVVPEPEPQVVEPDPAEEARIQAEEQRRLEDLRMEQERQQREDAQRRQREAEAEAERKAAEEAALERRRQEAEEQRQRDIERQRQENIEEEQRLQEQAQADLLAEEQAAIDAMNSTEMQVYQSAIRQKVQRNWVRPGTARDDLECFVAIRQLPNGEVVSVQVQECNGDDVVVRSIEAAVRKASPLPLPSNPILFLRSFTFRFTIPD